MDQRLQRVRRQPLLACPCIEICTLFAASGSFPPPFRPPALVQTARDPSKKQIAAKIAGEGGLLPAMMSARNDANVRRRQQQASGLDGPAGPRGQQPRGST